MYRGVTLLNLDGKSRVAVPTKYREALLTESKGSVVLTAHPHGCLLLYPQVAWEPIQNISIDNQDELPEELDGFSL